MPYPDTHIGLPLLFFSHLSFLPLYSHRPRPHQITIKREARTKRKHLTSIHGLESFDIDLKKAAKFFAQKFATGASVSKNAQGNEEIVIQGDVTEEVVSIARCASASIYSSEYPLSRKTTVERRTGRGTDGAVTSLTCNID